jgi:hypothetical protein
VNLHAAGIDVGAAHHFVAVPEGRDPDGHDVREFATFTADLCALANWLTVCAIRTVAMESTGVYWIPLFELLSGRGFDVKLVDPRQLKHVPGRKTDVLDCQWLQQLHNHLQTAGCRVHGRGTKPELYLCRLVLERGVSISEGTSEIHNSVADSSAAATANSAEWH